MIDGVNHLLKYHAMFCTLLADIYNNIDIFYFVDWMNRMSNNELLQLMYVPLVHYYRHGIMKQIVTITRFTLIM